MLNVNTYCAFVIKLIFVKYIKCKKLFLNLLKHTHTHVHLQNGHILLSTILLEGNKMCYSQKLWWSDDELEKENSPVQYYIN